MIKKVPYFNIHQIADSGQTFRWYPHEKGYIVVANHKAMTITQEGETIQITSLFGDSVDWPAYLGLDEDYEKIIDELTGKDDYLDKAIGFGRGIRILKQDPYEMVITFIISANNNIKRITSAVKLLSERYGTCLCEVDGVSYYDFPTPEELKNVTIEEYRACGLGYRDQYVYAFIQEIHKGLDVKKLKVLSDTALKDALLRLKGVGEKVANCILLFGYDRKEGFPIDTWIKKVLLAHYPVSEDKLKSFAECYFKPHGGIAQQYLFYYGRFHKN